MCHGGFGNVSRRVTCECVTLRIRGERERGRVLLPQLATAAILTLHADEALLPLQALQACEWLETKRCLAEFNIHSSV